MNGVTDRQTNLKIDNRVAKFVCYFQLTHIPVGVLISQEQSPELKNDQFMVRRTDRQNQLHERSLQVP